MEVKLIICILTTIVIQTTISQTSEEDRANNGTNLADIDLSTHEVGENGTIRTKRHPALLIKTRPIRLKRLPISNVYRRYPPPPSHPPPPTKYGPPQTSQNLSPPKIRYGPIKHKISGHPPIGVEYSPSSDYLESYSKPHVSVSDSSSHRDLLNGYQETHLVDTNGYDSYESYKTPIHFSSNSQSSNYEYYPTHQPSIPISNNYYNSDSSGSSIVSSSSSSSSSSGNKLKFPSHQPETYNENLESDSYSETYYSIPSTSYGVPSSSYGESQAQQQQEHQYSSYAPQQQSHSPQGTYNYQPAPVQHNPAPVQQSHSAVSYSPPADTYNYQHAQQTPISYKPPPNYHQSNQQGTYNFAEPPQSNKQHYQAPQQQQHASSKPVYSNSVTSYNPPENYPTQHNPSSKLQGAYNTPVPVYTNKKHYSNRATTKQTQNDHINAQTEKYDLQLDENNNSGSLYDTSISSYDVPVHYNYAKDQKSQKSYPPNENFEPSKPKKVPTPPMLPNIYDQEDFNSFKKSKNDHSPKIHQHELQDFSQFFDAAVFKPHPTQKPKKRTKYSSNRPPITNLNAFVSYEEILPTTEKYFDEATSTSTVNPRFRRKKITEPPPYLSGSSMNRHNLDTDDLRDAYGSSSHIHSSVIRTDAIAKFESMKNKNRLPPTSKPNETKSKNTNSSTKYHSNYSSAKPKEGQKYDVISIEKSKSHSYYAGTMAPSLAANLPSKRYYDVSDGNKHKTNHYDDDDDDDDDEDDDEKGGSNTKAFNVFSSGFYVSDGSVADVSSSTESDLNSDYYDNEDDFETTYKEGRDGNAQKPMWSGGSLPKNHKLTSKDVTVHS